MSATGDSGFTLLEMLVTLAIMGLIAGIGYPALTRMIDHIEFVRAVDDAAAGLRGARAAAIKAGQPFSFSLGNDRRWRVGGRELGAALPQAIRATMTEPQIAFFADGTARPAELRLSSGYEEWRVRIATNGLLS